MTLPDGASSQPFKEGSFYENKRKTNINRKKPMSESTEQPVEIISLELEAFLDNGVRMAVTI